MKVNFSQFGSQFETGNPRQEEAYELQRKHMNNLHFMHFQHRLNSIGSEKNQNQIPEDYEKNLEYEKKLLEEAKITVSKQVDRCEKLLQTFRQEREKKLQQMRKEIEERKLSLNNITLSIQQNSKTEPEINIQLDPQLSRL